LHCVIKLWVFVVIATHGAKAAEKSLSWVDMSDRLVERKEDLDELFTPLDTVVWRKTLQPSLQNWLCELGQS
jgi:hypothetical protein